MATVIGGHDTGLLDGSLYLLNRDDKTREGTAGHNEQLYVNVTNGNLVVRHTDAYLPSQGEDYAVVRTYNSRGNWNEGVGQGWTLTSAVELTQITKNNITLRNADGSYYEFDYDRATDIYTSTDGAGAYETITYDKTSRLYTLVRSDQTQLVFDGNGTLQRSTDTNGNTITYTYQSSKLVQVQDDTGHTITYEYGGSQGSELTRIVDSELGVLVEYSYSQGLLYSVTDRNGDVTTYQYYTDGTLAKITLPHDPSIEADIGKERAITFQYDPDTVDNSGTSRLLRYIWDAEGNPTAFEYQFYRDNQNNYNGGETVMINALGLYRSQSNDAEYVQWRLDNGYYAEWDPNSYDYGYFKDANGNYYFDQAQWDEYRAQTNEILTNHATWYYYDVDGNITLAGTFKTTGGNTVYEYADRYQYDADGNLTAVIDANGYALQYSDDQYWRDMRKELGYVDSLTGEGLLSSQLSSAQLVELAEFYTTHLEYDDRGNLIQKTDNEDNITTFTYTSFNKIASETSAMGHALTTSNDLFYQEKRVELGYAADVAALSASDIDALLALHTTTYSYDANQNLIEIRTPGGDLTTFEYDMYGNVTQKVVYLDQNDLTDPAKQQITQYFYDAYGNNIKTIEANAWSVTNSDDPYWVEMRKEFGIVDANGDGKLVADLSASDIDILTGNYTSYSNYDLFGNLLSYTDPNGGVTTYTYDNDNRLISVTDPEGHTTVYAYDSVGNRIGVTNANGHTNIYVYDRNNMLIAVQDWKTALGNGPDDRTTTYKYDVVGNRTAVVDANGFETTYVYREDNRLLQVITPMVEDGSGNPVQYTTSYAYDALGNRIQMVDNNGNVTNYVYNQNNLLKQTTDPIGNVNQYRYDANLNQVQITIGAQLAETQRRVLKYSYDEEDQLIAEVDAEGNVTRYSYDAVGNRVQVVDALGRVHEFEYDAQNRQIIETRPEVTDPYTGQPVQYTVVHYFDGNGNEIATTDENGHTTRVSYDKDDRAILIEDANGIKTAYTYDGNDNRTGVYIGVAAHLDNDGHVVFDDVEQAQITTYQYDEFNQVISRVDGLGNALAESDDPQYIAMRAELGYVDANGNGKLAADLTTLEQAELKALYTERYSYDKVGNLTQTIDNEGRLTSYAYDGLNRQTSMTDALGNTRTTHHDGNGNQVNVTDKLGRTTTYTYDANDRLIDTTDANGVVTHREYDDFGNLRFETRAYGSLEARTTEYRYDLDNRLIDALDPEGHQTHYRYDAVGNRLEVITAYGTTEAQSTQYVYDALNRNIKIIDSLSFETRYEYDGVGNRITFTDANGGITRFDYDPGNRHIQTTDAEGRVTSYSYDVRGNRITTTDGNGNVTTFEYDAKNNLRKIIDAEGNITEHDFDRVYNRIATTDGNGHTTSYAFDALNRQIAMTDALGNTTAYSYDAVGNRTSITDALGRVRTFEYDNVNRVITETAADGIQTTYSYDEVGNRTSITYAANTAQAATTTFEYNKDDQLIRETDALGNVTTYTYDANHNRTVVTDANGNATTYSYDDNNRVTHITDALGHVSQYVYDGNGNRIQVIDANGNTTTTYYNKNNEVDIRIDALGYATSYVYDNNGNVVSQTRHMTPISGPIDPSVEPTLPTGSADQTTTYEYDAVNRMTARIDAEGYRTEYAYDAVGNRTESRQQITADGSVYATTHTYYDDVNRIAHQLSAEGFLISYTYDAVGNRTGSTVYYEQVSVPISGEPVPAVGDNGRTTTFTYDANNRLVSETSALGITTAYTYDDRGNRTSIIDAQGTADERTTTFAFDKANRLTDTINANGIITHYVRDGVGNVLERYDAYGLAEQRVTTYLYDQVYRVVSETNAIGVTTTYSYDANGNRLGTTLASGVAGVERTITSEYDANNRVIAETNGEGERTEYVYDGAGNRIETIQAPGLAEERHNTFEYDHDNRLIATTDALGTRTEYVYDGAGNKLQTTQAVGLPEARNSYYVYDLDNNLVQVTDPQGGVTQYTYDALGNQIQIVDANGGVQTSTFDAVGQLIQTVSAGGVMTVNTYDARGNITSMTQSWADGSDARTVTYTFDQLDQQISTTDAEGFSATVTYDVFGNQVQVTNGQYLVDSQDPSYDPDKAARAHAVSSSFTYDAADRMTSMTDGIGTVTEYNYDAVGNRTQVIETANEQPRITTYSYDLANRQTGSVNPEGGRVETVYDVVGNKIEERKLQSVDGGGVETWITTTYEYDANDHRIAEVDSYGVRTEHDYDAMGNMTAHRYAAGTADERVVRMEYDFNNRLVADIDAEGNRTSYTYDSLGNRTSVTDALGRVATYQYDGSNNLIAVIDPEGYTTSYQYDAAGNQTQVELGGRVTQFIYNGANNISVRIDADGSETHYTYDGAGNLLTEVQYANTTAPRTLSYVYDNNSRLVEFTDVDGTITTFTYDAANNKTSETIYNATDPNTTRTTVYEYDLNNRKVSQTFDPNGLNYIQTLAYDALGNVVSKTDANGVATAYNYDLNNRVTSEIRDPGGLNLTTSYQYDAVGNLISETDPRGNTTDYVYNNNNQQTQVIAAEVTVYTIDGGERLERPTFIKVYDAAGNVIQEIDPNGFKTTRYYDGNDRIVAEIDAHNALREYRYNATGEQVEVKLYMTRLSDADHDPYTRPAAPAGEVRVTTNIFDAAGRIIETQHPETEITTLVGAETDSPSVTTQVVRVSETWSYDQFGNQIEYIDKNGNRNLYYYDVAGNMIASVDGAGYLTEWDYDAQGNQLEQRTYATPLDINSLDPSIYPTAPAGEVAVITNVYDAASHLIEERTPAFDVYNPLDPANPTSQQQITHYTYDGNGNQLSKTIAAGSNKEITEYSYYDNNDRLIAVINGERVLHLYTYDANGNVTKQERLYNTVPTTVDLTTLTGQSDFRSLVVADAANDQATEFEFDAVNRRIRETDLMGPGATDDLTQIYKYNATQQQTWVQDEDGYVTRMAFNGLGLAELTISPDGSGMIAEYDAAGNQISGFMGLVENQTTPATNITATVSDTLNLSWDLGGSVSMGSRVVYGTTSQSTPDGYAQQTGLIGSWGQSSASAAIDLSNLSAGDTLYFRVITQDQAGNITWSEEKSVTIPPRVTDVAVSQAASDSVTITANFEGGAQNPVLLYGAIQNTVNPVNFVQQPDGSWQATITGVSNIQDLAYQIQWSDAAGQTYTSAEQTFEASGGHTAVISTLGEGTVTTATGTGYVMNLHTEVPTALAETFSVVTADWRLTGAATGYASTANEGVLDAGGAFYNFDLTLGSSSAPLNAGEYEVVIRGVDANGNAVILDTLTYTVGQATPETLTSQSVSLAAPAIGDSQLVIVDGVRVDSVRQDGFTTFDINASGTQAYQVYYTDQLAEMHTSDFVSSAISHTVDITSTEVIITNPDLTTTTTYDLGINATFLDWEVAQMASGVTLSWRPAGSAGAYTNVLLTQSGNSFATTLSGLSGGQYELQLSYTDINGQTVVASTTTADTAVVSDSATYVTGHNLDISSALSAAEVANISGDVTLYWRDAANVDPSGLDFTNSQVMSLDGATNTLSGLIENVTAGQYDIKIAYTDVNGNEVVVDWYRADTAVASDSITAHSQILLGTEERDGSVTLSANGTISVDPGLYIGALDSAGLASELSLSVTATGQAGGSRDANGQSTGYFTEITYNALDQVIAEIGNDGLYKEYGVDANGNKVVTYNYGEQGNPDALISYAAYDARDRMIAQFDSAFVPEGGSAAQHPVTRFAYDYLDNVVSQTDARGYTSSTTYNALGQKTSMTDASGATTSWYYDIRGNEVAVTDGLGNTARKEYDDFGRVTAEINGEGNRIDYTYDVFGRKLTMARAGNVTSYAHDQRDRMTSMTDPLGGVTRYEYDGRDNQIWVYDPRWTATNNTYKYGQKYDSMGRVVEIYSYQDGQLATEQQVYDYYGNLIAEIDAMGRTKTTSYEGFGRVTETVDEGGQRIIKEYDAYGRMIREYDPNGQKDIRYSYDDNGNRTAIDDLATGVSTVYTYDLAGNRITETITTPIDAQGETTHNRSYTYIYDSRGNLVRWADSVTGMHLNYWYDAAGNLQRAYTDLGYDPDNQNSANDPTFRHVDHWYQYDSTNRLRLMTEGQNGQIISEYGYDSAGNRVYWNNKGNAVNYTFDANGQVKTGTWYTGSGADQVTHEQKWTYDKVGNVLSYRVYENGSQKEYSVYKYYENNTQYYSNSKPVDSDDASTTTSTFDLSGRLTGKVMRGNDYAITYHYEYYADGREKKITASGDSKGSSSFAYDANDNQIKVNLGKGNDQSRAEISTFVYDNEGHIIYKWHDDGESDTREKVEYAYANSNPVGETGVDNDANQATKLDIGDYNLVDNFGDTFPGTSVTLYKVNRGDTLQSIAAAMYGKPSLWFVIAEANGLNGTEQLEAGRQLEVPNSVQSGRLTSESHALYNESDIIGSTLPNLQAEGGGGSGCLQLLAIVIVVAIAIIAPYAVAALAGVMSAAIGTIAAYAIAGAVVYAAANIIQQGLLMAIGVQKEFDWGQVGTAAISGLFSGLAQGIQVDALETAKKAGEVSQYAKVASSALKMASVAVKQVRSEEGKINNWTGILSAGIGQYLSFGKAAADAAAAAAKTSEAAKAASEAANRITEIQRIVEYATPWVQLAETYIRNDGELTPMDWAGAVSSTLSTAVTDNSLDADSVQNAVNRMGVNLLVAGVVGSRSDVSREEAQSFFFNSVGNEIGQLIGGNILSELKGPPSKEDLLKPVFDPVSGEYVIRNYQGGYTSLESMLPSEAQLAETQARYGAVNGPMLQAQRYADAFGGQAISVSANGDGVSNESSLSLKTPEQRAEYASQIAENIQQNPDATLQMLSSMREVIASGNATPEQLQLYLTVLVAMGGTDPGFDFNTYQIGSGEQIAAIGDYALSSSIGDMYIKAQVAGTTETGNQNLQLLLMSRDSADSRLNRALIGTDGRIRTESGGYGRIGPATQASITEQDLINSSILRGIYQGGVSFVDGSSAAYVPITINGETKVIDFQSTFAQSMWPSNATLEQQRAANLESIQGVRPDTYIALLKGMYSDQRIIGATLSGGLRPGNTSQHSFGLGLDVAELELSDGTSIDMQNEGYRLSAINGQNNTYRATPENPYQSQRNAEIATGFNTAIASSYGVRGTGLNPSRAIPSVTLQNQQNNALVSPQYMLNNTTGFNHTIAKHYNHTHIEMNYRVRGNRTNNIDELLNYQRTWQYINSGSNPWVSM